MYICHEQEGHPRRRSTPLGLRTTSRCCCAELACAWWLAYPSPPRLRMTSAVLLTGPIFSANRGSVTCRQRNSILETIVSYEDRSRQDNERPFGRFPHRRTGLHPCYREGRWRRSGLGLRRTARRSRVVGGRDKGADGPRGHRARPGPEETGGFEILAAPAGGPRIGR